jgi:hypothetical protein
MWTDNIMWFVKWQSRQIVEMWSPLPGKHLASVAKYKYLPKKPAVEMILTSVYLAPCKVHYDLCISQIYLSWGHGFICEAKLLHD